LLEFFEEFRSNKAAEKLKELVATNATVLRDGKKIQIPIKEVTLGDIVLLSAGSMIPADLRVLQSKDVYVGQSSLTGEAESVRKLSFTQVTLDEIDNVSDLDTICFMGTNVISGSAKCAVIKTADSTYFGKVAKNITNNQSKSAFQKGIENISKLLIKFMFILTPIVFILNAWKQSPVTAFTFAVAIAICITPLLLPVIFREMLTDGSPFSSTVHCP
jgi:Mg2+-importing ATPase